MQSFRLPSIAPATSPQALSNGIPRAFPCVWIAPIPDQSPDQAQMYPQLSPLRSTQHIRKSYAGLEPLMHIDTLYACVKSCIKFCVLSL